MIKMKRADKKIILAILAILALMLLMTMTVFASGIESTELYKGTQKLIQSLTTALTGLVALITTCFAVWKGIQWQLADDQEKPRKKKELLSVIGIGILITTISGVIAVILSFYQQ